MTSHSFFLKEVHFYTTTIKKLVQFARLELTAEQSNKIMTGLCGKTGKVLANRRHFNNQLACTEHNYLYMVYHTFYILSE